VYVEHRERPPRKKKNKNLRPGADLRKKSEKELRFREEEWDHPGPIATLDHKPQTGKGRSGRRRKSESADLERCVHCRRAGISPSGIRLYAGDSESEAETTRFRGGIDDGKERDFTRSGTRRGRARKQQPKRRKFWKQEVTAMEKKRILRKKRSWRKSNIRYTDRAHCRGKKDF